MLHYLGRGLVEDNLDYATYIQIIILLPIFHNMEHRGYTTTHKRLVKVKLLKNIIPAEGNSVWFLSFLRTSLLQYNTSHKLKVLKILKR